jgi:hypothetical protein
MDGFETLVAEILEGEGFWVRRGVKVPLTKEEKRRIQRPSTPRWEIDLLAYRPCENRLLVVECKSYLDSPGVDLADLKGGKHATRYKLFTEPVLRDVVFGRLETDFVTRGLCRFTPTIQLALAAGRIRSDATELRTYFAANEWLLFDVTWLRERLQVFSDGGYVNSVAAMVAKLLLREQRARRRS